MNDKVIELLHCGVQRGSLLVGDLQVLVPSVNTASQRFLEIGGELRYAINLIDPGLATAVRQIYGTKGSILWMLSNSVRYTDAPAALEYFAPDSRILQIDMESYGQWVEYSADLAATETSKLEWPQDLLWSGDFEKGFHPARLLLDDRASLAELRTILEKHGAVLSSAREKLRVFIAAKFTLEDVLYVSKGMEREEVF